MDRLCLTMAKRRKTIIIDAYNLLRKVLRPGKSGGDLESARTVLEARLRAYVSRQPDSRLILVYDGDFVGRPSRRTEGGLEILFSRPPLQADDLVLDLARKLESTADVTVVTSDMVDIGNRLRGLHVALWSSQEFASLLASTANRGEGVARDAPGDEKPSEVASEEARAWVEEFGFGSFESPDVQEIRKGERGTGERKGQDPKR